MLAPLPEPGAHARHGVAPRRRWSHRARLRLPVILVMAILILVTAPAVHAASATPTPGTGDTRSSGSGAGLVGQPFLAAFGVVALGLLAVGGTVLYVRASARG